MCSVKGTKVLLYWHTYCFGSETRQVAVKVPAKHTPALWVFIQLHRHGLTKHNDFDLGAFKAFEYLAIEIKPELSGLIFTLYGAPRYPLLFLQENILNILNGYMNIHINNQNDSKVMEHVNLLDNFELLQHNKVTYQHGNFQDIITTWSNIYVVLELLMIIISDHRCVFLMPTYS